jgi:hypothetical protein
MEIYVPEEVANDIIAISNHSTSAAWNRWSRSKATDSKSLISTWNMELNSITPLRAELLSGFSQMGHNVLLNSSDLKQMVHLECLEKVLFFETIGFMGGGGRVQGFLFRGNHSGRVQLLCFRKWRKRWCLWRKSS